MKNLNYFLSLAVLVIILASAGCGGSDGPGVPADDQVGTKFASAWNATSVVFETTQDRSTDYANFVLTIGYNAETNEGSYSISGGPTDGTKPFASSGTWTFDGTIADPSVTFFNVLRNDGLVMKIEQLTDTNLQMSFSFDPADHESSRTEAVEGTWVFGFIK